MITCYIVDDEYRSINLLTRYIAETPGLELAGFSENPEESIHYISSNPPDLVFTDINMPQLSGIDLSARISLITTVIFTTAFPQYGAQAFDLQAADFLLKPFSYDRFLQALNRARFFSVTDNKVLPRPIKDHIYIKSETKGRMVRIRYSEIKYIEGAQNYVNFHLDTESHLSYLTLKEVEGAICPDQFCRIHKSHIINTEKIKSIENGAVILEDRTMKLIGANYRALFLEKLSAHTLISKRH